jgi:hypothetical protein
MYRVHDPDVDSEMSTPHLTPDGESGILKQLADGVFER